MPAGSVASSPCASPIEETLQQLNISSSEYQTICDNLGREPNFNELAMFSVLWSEHCCYKNSRHLLKLLPSKGKRVLHGPGENAGVVEIGDGIQVGFKIESHNHPTAVEPFQGAATGVGGILRDIFTMNARPIANLNALRFGSLNGETSEAKRNRFLLSGAVKGIAHYGNCVGVPTIGGEVFFDDCFTGNPLVNAMAIGIVYNNDVTSSKAAGIGNPVLYVGSATGRDGMGGAAFASKELDENSQADRPAVQVGDPFAEKVLIEACLEAFATGCVVAAQDMGAAGLTSSSCEMAAKGGVGMDMDLDKVPAREPDMQPHEFLLSESQERMLFVLEKDKEQPVLDIFAKWRIPAVVIGEIADHKNIRFYHKGQLVVDVPAELLTDLAPSYNRGENPPEPEAAKARREKDTQKDLPDIAPAELNGWLLKMMGSENIAKPSGIFSQYDRHVQNNTLQDSENNGSGVIRLRKKDGSFSGKALAATVDCNSRFVYLDPYQGSLGAVMQAARNLACMGAFPLAVSDNLNFGNPEKPEIYHQLYHAVIGIKDGCEALEIPVVSGNVSLYNEHSGAAIYPTPTIAMIGLIENDQLTASSTLTQAGLKLAVLGDFKPVLGGSEYQKVRTGKTEGQPPSINMAQEVTALQTVLQLIEKMAVVAVQDISMGGVLPTLLEMGFENRLGFSLNLDSLKTNADAGRLDALYFGETAGSYIVACTQEQEVTIQQICQAQNVSLITIGQTSSDFTLTLPSLTVDLAPIEHVWSTHLARL